MSDRNRAEGWQHAKLSGHKNERLIAELTRSNPALQKRILDCAHIDNAVIQKIEYGGLCETDIDCIFEGTKTKSKTDMWLLLSNGNRLNISIKKDEGGQVFLIGIDRFIKGFELQYNKIVHADVKRAISLYFGSAKDTLDIVQQYGSANKKLETRKHRLVADTLKAYDSNLAECLLAWLNLNIRELFDYCFARGLAKNPQDWAQIVWYKNMVGENEFDTLIYLPDIMNLIKPTAQYGNRNGGSTIQLPFGFVQWHSPRKVIPGSLQFHHNYSKIIGALR